MRIVSNIELFGNAFIVRLRSGESLTYRVGRKARIYLRKNPAGLLWTEPTSSYDAVNNTSTLSNYIIYAEKNGRMTSGKNSAGDFS